MDSNVEYEMVFGGAENPTCVSPTEDICFDPIGEVPHQRASIQRGSCSMNVSIYSTLTEHELAGNHKYALLQLLLDMAEERAMMYNFTAIIRNQTSPERTAVPAAQNAPAYCIAFQVDGYGYALAQSVVHSPEGAHDIEGIQIPGRAGYYYFIVFYNELFGIVPEAGWRNGRQFVAFLLADWVGPFTPTCRPGSPGKTP
ncbi:hypothetical protein BD779DRAFT_1502977 [Infundibulicybe gibba]|nr:hypothetical protein BD779DRAFT_1502977 [Infundibulicybe gibba]